MDFTELVDLASERLGGRVVVANDEFFAPKENLLKASPPVFREGEYTDRGKWMDGWETRRRREPGHDWCIVRLGVPGTIRGVLVDTSYFVGNYPPECSVDALHVDDHKGPHSLAADGDWREIVPRSPLSGDRINAFPVEDHGCWTHVRLNIYPDGGVARFRVHGEVVVDRARLAGTLVDLAAADHGGVVVAASDMFFGSRQNLILPGAARGMYDGWETKRRRGPGHDWVVVRLGAPGTIERVDVDTSYFKGNAPASCSLDVSTRGRSEPFDPAAHSWIEALARTALQPDTPHQVDVTRSVANVTYARLNIFPDGGIARLRLLGRIGE